MEMESKEFQLKKILYICMVGLISLPRIAGDTSTIMGGLGGMVELPCIPPGSVHWGKSGTSLQKVEWQMGAEHRMLCTYSPNKGTACIDNRTSVVLKNSTSGSPALPNLILKPILKEDHLRAFSCTSQYADQIISSRTILTVATPSGYPTILWNGRVIGAGTSVGPVNEDEEIELTCRVVGGWPTPTVTWWVGGVELKTTTGTDGTGTAREASASWAKLKLVAHRKLSGVPLVCHSHTDDRVMPRTSAVSLDITLPPTQVYITTGDLPLTEGDLIQLKCQSLGSRPPADHVWKHDGRRLAHVATIISDNGDKSSSTVTVQVSRSDHLTNISCSAVNPRLSAQHVDVYTFNIGYKPLLKLKLGEHFQSSEIKQGQDVFFICEVDANPVVDSIIWKYNGDVINSDLSNGIIVSGEHLALRNVQSKSSGIYTCSGSNLYGISHSEEIIIKVHHTPECVPPSPTRPQTKVMREKGAIVAMCYVRAYPNRNLHYTWERVTDPNLNNDVKIEEIRQYDRTHESLNMIKSTLLFKTNLDKKLSDNREIIIQNFGLVSKLIMPLRVAEHYNSIQCRAKNDVGYQKEPCIIKLVEDIPSKILYNCSVNESPIDIHNSVFHVRCTIDSLNEFRMFFLQAYQQGVLVANITSPRPYWDVQLNSKKGVNFKMWTGGQKGFTNPVIVNLAAKQTIEVKEDTFLQPIIDYLNDLGSPSLNSDNNALMVTILVVLSGCVVVVMVVILLLLRYFNSDDVESDECNFYSGNEELGYPWTDSSGDHYSVPGQLDENSKKYISFSSLLDQPFTGKTFQFRSTPNNLHKPLLVNQEKYLKFSTSDINSNNKASLPYSRSWRKFDDLNFHWESVGCLNGYNCSCKLNGFVKECNCVIERNGSFTCSSGTSPSTYYSKSQVNSTTQTDARSKSPRRSDSMFRDSDYISSSSNTDYMEPRDLNDILFNNRNFKTLNSNSPSRTALNPHAYRKYEYDPQGNIWRKTKSSGNFEQFPPNPDTAVIINQDNKIKSKSGDNLFSTVTRKHQDLFYKESNL